MREKKKEREELKASCPKSLIVSKKLSGYSVFLGLYTAPKQYKLPKSIKAVNCYKDKMGRNQKGNKKAKIQTGSRKVKSAVKGKQWHRRQIRNPAFCFFSSSGLRFFFLLVYDL